MGVHGRFVVVEPDGSGGASGPGGLETLFEAVAVAASSVEAAPGVRVAKGWLGFPFSPETRPEGPDLRLVALSALGDDRPALDEAFAAATAGLVGAARYDVLGECVKATGSGWGFEVPTDGVEPLDHGEPVFVVIIGDVRPEHLGSFTAAAVGAVAHAEAQPGYLGGCGLASTMFDITSFSCWASARDARRYAFGAGGHADAMRADQSEGWHDMTTNLFLTFRVLAASGSLLGRRPFVADTGTPAR